MYDKEACMKVCMLKEVYVDDAITTTWEENKLMNSLQENSCEKVTVVVRLMAVYI